jgi:hypothetical protein
MLRHNVLFYVITAVVLIGQVDDARRSHPCSWEHVAPQMCEPSQEIPFFVDTERDVVCRLKTLRRCDAEV